MKLSAVRPWTLQARGAERDTRVEAAATQRHAVLVP